MSHPKQDLAARLKRLTRRKRFFDWRQAPELAEELEDWLADLESVATDRVPAPELSASAKQVSHAALTALEAVTLLLAFFRADSAILEYCDDSDGVVGQVFTVTACELFVHYAVQIADKAWLSDEVYRLCCLEEDSGVRGSLLKCASEFLPPEALHGWAERLLQLRQQSGADDRRFTQRFMLLAIARQLRDLQLLEAAWRDSSDEKLGQAACLDLAKLCLTTGAPQTALDWLAQIEPGIRKMDLAQDELALEAHLQLGQREPAEACAWRIFRRKRSAETLEKLLAVIGAEQRESVVVGEAAAIMRTACLDYSDAQFLVDMGRLDEAERYLLQHGAELDGERYYYILPLAKAMERAGKLLTATMLYRALLDSILVRAQSRYYYHGVRYLDKLDQLSQRITVWHDISPHAEYLDGLCEKHKRKYSFWRQVAED